MYLIITARKQDWRKHFMCCISLSSGYLQVLLKRIQITNGQSCFHYSFQQALWYLALYFFIAFLNRCFQISFGYNVWFLIYLTLAHLRLTYSAVIAYVPRLPPCTIVNFQMKGNVNRKIYLKAYKCVSENIANKDSFLLLLNLHFCNTTHSFMHPFPSIYKEHPYFYVGNIYESHNVLGFFSIFRGCSFWNTW